MIDRVAAALKAVAGETIVSANATDASSWIPGVRVVPDVLQGGGAAAGIHAALRACAAPILVIGWDMPFVTPELLRALVSFARDGDFDAVVPAARESGALEPLCAWYAPAAAAAIESRWNSGRRGLHELLGSLNTCILPADFVATIGEAERLFFNVNTQADLEAARALAARS